AVQRDHVVRAPDDVHGAVTVEVGDGRRGVPARLAEVRAAALLPLEDRRADDTVRIVWRGATRARVGEEDQRQQRNQEYSEPWDARSRHEQPPFDDAAPAVGPRFGSHAGGVPAGPSAD